MSTQYRRLCASCQTASQWITFSTNTCTDAGQIVKKENYNEVLAGAKSIQNYGYNGTARTSGSYTYYTSTDDGSTEAPNVASMSNIAAGASITKANYNDLASKLLSSYTAAVSGNSILGSYWTGLKNGLRNFSLEARRYTTYTCYDDYSVYSRYSNYSVYSEYSDGGGGCWSKACETIYM